MIHLALHRGVVILLEMVRSITRSSAGRHGAQNTPGLNAKVRRVPQVIQSQQTAGMSPAGGGHRDRTQDQRDGGLGRFVPFKRLDVC